MKTISFSEERLESALSSTLHDAVWGTIGPESVKAAEELSALLGAENALFCSCPAGAAETVLRALEVTRGDEVVLPAYCSAFLKNAVESVGAKAVFCDVNDALLMTPEYLQCKITPATVAVFCEEIAGFPLRIKELHDICQAHDVPLIDCTATPFMTRYRSKPCVSYSDIALCLFPVQDCAALVTDRVLLPKLYGAHHCGNPYGTPGGLNTGICLGGDMRIDEFRAAAVRVLLSDAEERMRMFSALKVRLWDAFVARGCTPVSICDEGDSAGTFLLFKKSQDTNGAILPPYCAHTDTARILAEGISFIPTLG